MSIVRSFAFDLRGTDQIQFLCLAMFHIQMTRSVSSAKKRCLKNMFIPTFFLTTKTNEN